jgi:hypothetical protein
VSASGFRLETAGFEFSPLEGFTVEGVEVVEGLSFVGDTSVATEDVNFSIVEGGGVVGSGLGSTDFGFSILRLGSGLLVRGLRPLEVGSLEDIGVIESLVGGIVASEDEEFVGSNGAGSVVGSGERKVSRALLGTPFAVAGLANTKNINLVIGSDLSVLLFVIETSEEDEEFDHGSDSVTGTRGGRGSSDF